MNFPLYSTLMPNLPKKDLTIAQKNDFIKKVGSLDSEAHDLLYALIKCYFFENGGNDTLTIPYKGKLHKDRIDFNLLELPVKLRQLLYKFVNVHKKKLLEDKEIQEGQNQKKQS